MRIMKPITKLATILAALSLGSAVGCTDFLSGGRDPNRPTITGPNQLFVGAQTRIWSLYGSELNRIAAMFTQHGQGIFAQYFTIYQYGITEETTGAQHEGLYTAGGLVDIRQIKRLTERSQDYMFLGVAQVQEALVMSLGADIFGDLVYSQALRGGTPELDEQMDVYNSLLVLLDSAIVNIASTAPTSTGPGASDLVYWSAGNVNLQRERWTRLAHSLKARIYMHMAEVNSANYALALTEASQGILSPADDYQAVYSGAPGESNLLYYFVYNIGYIVPNPFIINMMKSLNHPRFDEYFSTFPPSDGGTDTTYWYAFSFVDPSTPQKIMTADETRLIWAEAAYRTGQTASGGDAEEQLEAYRDMHDFPSLAPLSGTNLLRTILQEKYIALFHQIEPYNDWKRTCYPNLAPTVSGGIIPGRLYYDTNERNTNPNIPGPNQQPARNDNDPRNAQDPFNNPCLGNGETGGDI